MASTKTIEKNISTAQEEIITSAPRPRRRGLAVKFSGLLFIAVIVLGVLYLQQRTQIRRLTDPVAQTEYAEQQVKKVIEDLKQYVVIPDEEQLQLLGVINDAESLKKDQAFYANVERGDYVFLFTKTSRALIWRPSTKKIVNFGIADTTQAQQQGNIQKSTPTAAASSTQDN
ncbi:MAG: hypothetical protein RJB39_378 [Candidatus Parcubacteria bacterium]|jgi:hypothetical protein